MSYRVSNVGISWAEKHIPPVLVCMGGYKYPYRDAMVPAYLAAYRTSTLISSVLDEAHLAKLSASRSISSAWQPTASSSLRLKIISLK
jgi:hypothetical protein